MLVRAYAWLALLQRTGVINQLPARSRHHRRAVGAGAQHLRHRRCHLAHSAAIHGAAALCHHAENSARPDAGRRQPRRQSRAHVLADIPAAVAARRARRQHPGVRAVSGLLHHAGTAGRRPHRHGIDAGEPQCRTLQPMGRGKRRRRGPADQRRRSSSSSSAASFRSIACWGKNEDVFASPHRLRRVLRAGAAVLDPADPDHRADVVVERPLPDFSAARRCRCAGTGNISAIPPGCRRRG